MNEMRSFPGRASEFSGKGGHRHESERHEADCPKYCNMGRNKEKGMWKTRGGRHPPWGVESLAHSHTVILSGLICEMGMILVFYQFYLQMQRMIRMNKVFVASRVSKEIFFFFFLPRRKNNLNFLEGMSSAGGLRVSANKGGLWKGTALIV